MHVSFYSFGALPRKNTLGILYLNLSNSIKPEMQKELLEYNNSNLIMNISNLNCTQRIVLHYGFCANLRNHLTVLAEIGCGICY